MTVPMFVFETVMTSALNIFD